MDSINQSDSVEITDICRACLNKTKDMKSLLENNDNIAELLTRFIAVIPSIEIQIGYKYPSYLCSVCEEKINISYEFQQQFVKSNDLITQYLAAFGEENTESPSDTQNSDNLPSNLLKMLPTENLHPISLDYDLTNAPAPDEVKISECETTPSEIPGITESTVLQAISDLEAKYKDINNCKICSFKAVQKKYLSLHMSIKHREVKDNWCYICNETFSNIAEHSKEHNEFDFRCQFCQTNFLCEESLIEHLYTHKASLTDSKNAKPMNSTKKFSCKVCQEYFQNKKLLQLHCKKHKLTCNSCNKSFLLEINFAEHVCKCEKGNDEPERVEVKPDPEETEQCIIDCQEEENHKAEYPAAIQEEFKDFCPKEVPKITNTAQHMRLKQYAIEDVEKVMNVLRKKFYRHVSCVCCSFAALNIRSLSVHMTRIHRNIKHKWCSLCNKLFDDIIAHQPVHANDLMCPFCRKVKSNMGHLMEHLSSHSVDRFHKCTVCFKSFISARHLRWHQVKHAKDRPFKCKICGRRFVILKSLRSHYRSHSSEEKAKVLKSFVDENTSKLVDNVKTEEFIEINEAELKSESNNFEDKLESVDMSEESLSQPQNYCTRCDKKVRSLAYHNKKFHSNNSDTVKEEMVLCPHCGKQFKKKSKLTVHMRIHTGEAPYKCQYCEKMFKTRNILISHERTHTKEKPYICSVCGKGFAQSSTLKTHLAIHTGRPEQCTVCGKRFCRPALLNVHMREHTGEKPYTCEHCGKGFKQKSHLVEHSRKHSDDRPFKCETCKRGFKNMGTLKSHLVTHGGPKPFKCSQCPYTCIQHYSLTRHMLRHDADPPRSDFPHTCEICKKKFSTLAHLMAHGNRYHTNLQIGKIETIEIIQKLPEQQECVNELELKDNTIVNYSDVLDQTDDVEKLNSDGTIEIKSVGQLMVYPMI